VMVWDGESGNVFDDLRSRDETGHPLKIETGSLGHWGIGALEGSSRAGVWCVISVGCHAYVAIQMRSWMFCIEKYEE